MLYSSFLLNVIKWLFEMIEKQMYIRNFYVLSYNHNRLTQVRYRKCTNDMKEPWGTTARVEWYCKAWTSLNIYWTSWQLQSLWCVHWDICRGRIGLMHVLMLFSGRGAHLSLSLLWYVCRECLNVKNLNRLSNVSPESGNISEYAERTQINVHIFTSLT